MLDDPMNISNCLGCLEFDSYDAEEMKSYLLARVGEIHRCRSKLTKIFGLWWFETMEDEEWNKKKKHIVTIKEGIQNEAQLFAFIEGEMTIRDPLDTV